MLLVADNTRLQLLSVPAGDRTRLGQLSTNTYATGAGFARDGSRLGMASTLHVGVWDARSGQKVAGRAEKAKGRRTLSGFALSPDGSELAVGVFAKRKKAFDTLLEIYGVPDMELRRSAKLSGTGEVRTIDWIDEGIFVGLQTSLGLHDASTLKRTKSARVQSKRAFAPLGPYAATLATRGEKCALQELFGSWSAQTIFEDDAGSPEACVGVSPDGAHVVRGRGRRGRAAADERRRGALARHAPVITGRPSARRARTRGASRRRRPLDRAARPRRLGGCRRASCSPSRCRARRRGARTLPRAGGSAARRCPSGRRAPRRSRSRRGRGPHCASPGCTTGCDAGSPSSNAAAT